MYAATVNAWYATAMEFDRAVVTLSAAALGLLIGLATTGDQKLTQLEAVIYCLALVFFCLALACLLMVFKKNKDYLEEMVSQRDAARKSHPFLAFLDWAGLICFVLGAVLALSLGISAVQRKVIHNNEASMSDKGKVTPSVPVFESFNGAVLLNKSFNGATALAARPSTPVASAAAPAASAPAPAPAASAATQAGNTSK